MAIGNIAVADATPVTPVVHTFVPIADGNEARYVNETGALTLAGQETIGFNVKRATDGKSPHTVRTTLYDPVEVTSAGGITTVDHGNSLDFRFNLAQSATLQKKLDLIQMGINLLIAMKNDIANVRPQI